jgi:hypothetical protein
MARFDLIGPTYQSQSLVADCQLTRNWYVEFIESQKGKSAAALYPTPGTSIAYTIPGGGPSRAKLEINSRCFEVSSTNFVELFANGTFNIIAQVTNDLLPASMVASPQQLLIAAGGNLYVYQLQTQANRALGNGVAGTFVQIPNANFTLPGGAIGNPSMVEYIDGFFIVLLRNSQTIYLSTPLDATSWPALNIIVVSVFSDNVQSICENQRRLWVLGRKRSTVYYDSGGLNIFDVDPSGTIENGALSVNGFCRADNSVFWLDQEERGGGIVRRASGYTPVRVSNHAVENALQGYVRSGSTLSDCVAYSYEEDGHTFVVFQFPTAQKTWAYDTATGMWHERAYWNISTGLFSAHKSANHAFAFSKHLIGDPGSGNIYQQSIPIASGSAWKFADDFGNPIKRIRRAPHVGLEFKRMFYSELHVDVETGLGPQPPLLDGAGNARDPLLMLRFSKDYSKTWSNEYELPCGQAGQYRKRVRRSRMGSSKTGMVFELSATDPIPWRLVEGYLDAQPGYAAQERLVKTFGKVA